MAWLDEVVEVTKQAGDQRINPYAGEGVAAVNLRRYDVEIMCIKYIYVAQRTVTYWRVRIVDETNKLNNEVLCSCFELPSTLMILVQIVKSVRL